MLFAITYRFDYSYFRQLKTFVVEKDNYVFFNRSYFIIYNLVFIV